MITYKARTYYNGDGATLQFAVPFPYLDKANVHAYVDGIEKTISSWPSTSTVQFAAAPAVGSGNLEIRRVTPDDALLHSIQTGTILPADINTDNVQLLYISQELEDALHGPLDLGGHKISNLGDGTLGTDAANLETVNSLILAALNQGTGNPTGAVLASYGVARLLNLSQMTDGTVVFIKGRAATADGGQGFFKVTSANPGYADDDGMVLKNTANAFWFVRLLADHISLNWYQVYPAGAGDTSPALRAAIAAANFFQIREIRSFGTLQFLTQICNATFGWELPGGLTFRGVGQDAGSGAQAAPGHTNATWIYNNTGSTTDMFDIRGADGTGGASTTANIEFRDLVMLAAAGCGMFSINRLRQGGADYTPGVGTFPNFIQNIRFKNIKGSGHFDRWFLLARNCFEISVDADCYINNFLRGVQLTGSDDCKIEGRYDGNASRHIMVEKQGTFGNSNKLEPNFLGTHLGSDSSETHYAIYDTGESTYMESLYAEVDGSKIDAILYLGGSATRIICPKMYGIVGNPAAKYFRLGPFAVNVMMICPDAPTLASIDHPIIDAQDASTFFAAAGYDNYDITIINPSRTITARINTDPRVRIINGSSNSTPGLARLPVSSMSLSANGVGLRRWFASAQDIAHAEKVGAIGITAKIVDTATGNLAGQAIQLSAATGNGLSWPFVTNREFTAGDQLKFRLLCRCTTIPGAGNLKLDIQKNGVSQSTATTALAGYVVKELTLDTTGFATGDTVTIVVTNNGMTIAGLIGAVELINTSS